MERPVRALSRLTSSQALSHFAPVVAITQVVALIYLLLPESPVHLLTTAQARPARAETCPLHLGQPAPMLTLWDESGNACSMPMTHGTPLILILADACSNCTLSSLGAWQELCQDQRRARVVLAAPIPLQALKDVRERLAASGLPIEVFSSQASEVGERYAPGFSPRAFCISPHGLIEYLQRPGDSAAESAHAIARLLATDAAHRTEATRTDAEAIQSPR